MTGSADPRCAFCGYIEHILGLCLKDAKLTGRLNVAEVFAVKHIRSRIGAPHSINLPPGDALVLR